MTSSLSFYKPVIGWTPVAGALFKVKFGGKDYEQAKKKRFGKANRRT